MNTKTQPPTLAQAIEAVMRCLTLQCRRQNLAYFRERQGDAFADRVEAEVRRRFKGASK